MLGAWDGARLAVEEVHRFENGPVRVGGGLDWNVLHLLAETQAAIGRCTQCGIRLNGVGVDAWGVDFGLLAGGELLGLPRHYRDPRNAAAMARVLERVPRDEIYRRTGIQFLPFNTLFPAAELLGGPLGRAADRLLFMPDLLTYWLTGVAATEPCIASTSQMLDPRTLRWDTELAERAGVPARVLPEIVPTGTVAGPLRAEVAASTGQSGVPVIRTAAHDTAAAVAAVPAHGDDWAYISSGTWSLVGVERTEPLINADSCGADFTNEVGVGPTIRLLKNVAGLWLLQECRRAWAAAGDEPTYPQLLAEARAARSTALIDPDAPLFADPGDMPQRIADACARTGQAVPETRGALVRCILRSLALKTRRVVATRARLTGRPIRTLHVVGGGSSNELLCQWTADATGRPVVAGPVEATAAGNILVQARADGAVRTRAEMRAIVARSTSPRTYEPGPKAEWDEAAERAEISSARRDAPAAESRPALLSNPPGDAAAAAEP